MNYIHIIDDTAESKKNVDHESRNVFVFLKKNFPEDPRPIGAIQQGFIDVIPPSPLRQAHYRHQEGSVPCSVWGNHIFIGESWDYWNREPGPVDARGRATNPIQPKIVKVDSVPVSMEIVGPAVTQIVRKSEHRCVDGKWQYVDYEGVDTYTKGEPEVTIPYPYLPVRFSAPDAESVQGLFKFMLPNYGTATLDPNGGDQVTVSVDFHGMTRTWTESLKLEICYDTITRTRSSWYGGSRTETYTDKVKRVNDPMPILQKHLKASVCPDGVDAWWDRLVKLNPTICTLAKDPDKSLASVFKKKEIKPIIERLQVEDPIGWFFFQWLRDGRTKDKRCNNNLLAAMLTSVGGDFDKLKEALRQARQSFLDVPMTPLSHYNLEPNWEVRNDYKEDFWFGIRRDVCLTLPGAKERHEDLEAKADFTKQRDLAKAADTLEVSETEYPLLRQAIIDGKIPIAVFRQPDKNPVNLEFPLWERALAREGWAEVIYEIADDAGRRGTYDRDITPYLAFLFRIEKYLDRHAPTNHKKKGWSAMPKYVQSQSELELNDEDEQSGTIKRRSAFTPVADNETYVITVPYIAVRVSGVVTQWCYAKHYHVFEEGMTDPISGGVVINDLEVKLNGRDDYGLCFYTLTGTDTATGYPTFLIIFERLRTKTRVHFHRVRPCRSKDGIKTVACKLVEACYQFMAGNVPASEIAAQQGDLMFIPCNNDPIKAGAKVKDPQEGRTLEFESHKFLPLGDGGKMVLHVSDAKQPANRLGFLWAPNGLRVEHPEHDDIQGLVEGWWEIRRAKSYENNPVAIWSRTID